MKKILIVFTLLFLLLITGCAMDEEQSYYNKLAQVVTLQTELNSNLSADLTEYAIFTEGLILTGEIDMINTFNCSKFELNAQKMRMNNLRLSMLIPPSKFENYTKMIMEMYQNQYNASSALYSSCINETFEGKEYHMRMAIKYNNLSLKDIESIQITTEKLDSKYSKLPRRLI